MRVEVCEYCEQHFGTRHVGQRVVIGVFPIWFCPVCRTGWGGWVLGVFLFPWATPVVYDGTALGYWRAVMRHFKGAADDRSG